MAGPSLPWLSHAAATDAIGYAGTAVLAVALLSGVLQGSSAAPRKVLLAAALACCLLGVYGARLRATPLTAACVLGFCACLTQLPRGVVAAPRGHEHEPLIEASDGKGAPETITIRQGARTRVFVGPSVIPGAPGYS